MLSIARAVFAGTLTGAVLLAARTPQNPTPAIPDAPLPTRADAAGPAAALSMANLRADMLAGRAAPLLQAEGADWWGLGATYKARFGAQAIEFVPRLGPAVPRNHPIGYALRALGRGEALAPVAAAERRRADLHVDYVRPELTETYTLRGDGVEQSFTLAALPPGEGDLVLRGRLDTDFAVAADGDGLRCTLDGVGSTRIDGLAAVDADGHRVAGTVRLHDGEVDYVLPAAFLAKARLPLTVDPLFGSVFGVMTGAANYDQEPSVAFDLTTGNYLVAISDRFSATDSDVYAQRVGVAGNLVGSLVGVDLSTIDDLHPRVADVRLRSKFVVVWQRQIGGSDVMARAVDAATGNLSAGIGVATGTDTQDEPDVSGEATTADQNAICVWHNNTSSAIEAAQIAVNADGTLLVQNVVTIETGPVVLPRIDKSGGATGRHLIVWMQQYSSTDWDPHGVVVDRELNVLTGVTTFDSGVNYTTAAAVDGDGTSWVVAWQLQEGGAGTPYDLEARACAYGNGLNMLSPIVPVAANAGQDDNRPSVCWLGETSVIAYASSPVSGASQVYVRAIDAMSCGDCEGNLRLVSSLSGDFAIAGASRRSGGDTVDEALFAVETHFGTDSDIRAQRYVGDAAAVREVMAACGAGGGAVYASCARGGNAGFTIRDLGATPNQTAWLIGSHLPAAMPCGTCRLVPDPYLGFVQVTNVDGGGTASLPVPLPAASVLVGFDVYLQWLIVSPVTPGCRMVGCDLSNAVRVSFQ